MQQQLTKSTKMTEVIRNWHVVDAKDQILGRIAVAIAHKLMGKTKVTYVRNLDLGDNVVVINAKYIRVTGKKDSEKLYSNYSGFPGGLKQKPLWKVKVENPAEPIKRAVYGMLPKNKLRDKLITRLFIYGEATHPYTNKVFVK